MATFQSRRQPRSPSQRTIARRADPGQRDPRLSWADDSQATCASLETGTRGCLVLPRVGSGTTCHSGHCGCSFATWARPGWDTARMGHGPSAVRTQRSGRGGPLPKFPKLVGRKPEKRVQSGQGPLSAAFCANLSGRPPAGKTGRRIAGPHGSFRPQRRNAVKCLTLVMPEGAPCKAHQCDR